MDMEDDARAWWLDGVLARPDEEVGTDPSRLAKAAATASGLGADGLIVRPGPTLDADAAVAAARASGIHLVIEWSGPVRPDDAAAWLRAGAQGLAFDLDGGEGAGDDTVRALRGSLDPAARPVLMTGVPTDGADLVLDPRLTAVPWRAEAWRRAIETVQGDYPAPGWPGRRFEAPRRSPFALGLDSEAMFTCALALHLTLRGTPCLSIDDQTRLGEANARAGLCRDLIGLRKREVALRRGDQRLLAQEKTVVGFLREYEADRLAAVFNLGRRTRSARLPMGFAWTILAGAGPDVGHRITAGEVDLPACGWAVARAGAPIARTLGGKGNQRASGS